MKKKPFSILQTIDLINDELKNEENKACAYEDNDLVQELTAVMGKKMKRTPLSALHFAAVFCLTVDEDTVQLREIIRFMKVPVSSMKILTSELNALVEAGLIYREENYSGRTEFGVPVDIRRCVFADEIPSEIDLTTDVFGFHEHIHKHMNVLENNRSQYDYVVQCLTRLIQVNPELPVCKWIIENKLPAKETIFTLAIFNRSMRGYSAHQVRELCELASKSSKERFLFRQDLLKGKHLLFNKGIIVWEGDDVQSNEVIELTPEGMELILGPDATQFIDEGTPTLPKGLNDPEKIVVKKLFYNDREKEEITRLEEIIMPDRFDEVCERFKAQGMNAGICVLLYGGPGTGKTESVLQLAKRSGRPISQVDISTIKDKWVGESEKRAKAIFNDYRRLCKNSPATPILLLNEADAIINKRISVERSVDQMSNAIQNIFLDEMEKFEGILIATTNLQNNFDPAFDRRFLYKLRFDKPSVEVRAQILLERIPSISEADARYLAGAYELSGGQVENVARKSVTETLLKGTIPDRTLLERFCAEESGFRQKGGGSSRIGFSIDPD